MDLAIDTLTFLINAPIIETIVDDLFFCDDEQFHKFDDEESNDDVTKAIAKKAATKAKQKANAMKLFVQNEGDPHYTVIMKTVMRFELTMDHVFVGMSFCQTAACHPACEGLHQDCQVD
jgi:hypothetical protein